MVSQSYFTQFMVFMSRMRTKFTLVHNGREPIEEKEFVVWVNNVKEDEVDRVIERRQNDVDALLSKGSMFIFPRMKMIVRNIPNTHMQSGWSVTPHGIVDTNVSNVLLRKWLSEQIDVVVCGLISVAEAIIEMAKAPADKYVESSLRGHGRKLLINPQDWAMLSTDVQLYIPKKRIVINYKHGETHHAGYERDMYGVVHPGTYSTYFANQMVNKYGDIVWAEYNSPIENIMPRSKVAI